MHTRDVLARVAPARTVSTGAVSLGDSKSSSSSDVPSTPVWKNCVYFARGFCKHGTSCRFVHTQPNSTSSTSAQTSPAPKTPQPLSSSDDSPSEPHLDTPPRGPESSWLPQLQAEIQELLFSQGSPVAVASLPQLYMEKYGRTLQADGHSPEGYRSGRSITALLRLLMKLKGTVTIFDRPDGQKAVSLKRPIVQKAQDAEFTISDNPNSRQIYLTFPAESTFSENDVASHFGMFGTVHDVRIPYQQKRMFGFVTFASPAAVKAVLKQGNPHHICGSRVLVKPYRERTKSSERPKYVEAPRGQATDQASNQRGFFESKLAPRHLVARSENKLGLSPRIGPGSLAPAQSWSPRRPSPGQLPPSPSIPPPPTPSAPPPPPPPALQPLTGSPPDDQCLGSLPLPPSTGAQSTSPLTLLQNEDISLIAASQRDHVDDDLADEASLAVEVEEAPSFQEKDGLLQPDIMATMNTHTDTDHGDNFEDTPLPKIKLFQDTPHTPGQVGSDVIREHQSMEETAPLEDWNIDLDSILPESPFSSPKRTGATYSNSPRAKQENSADHDWHPSPVPSDQQPPPGTWMYGESMPFMPPVNAYWNPAGQFQAKFPSHLVHSAAAMEDISHSMALLAVSQMNHGLPGPHHLQPDKHFASSGSRAFCMTCRQQQVAGPNSQCTCCQQLLCQSGTHVAHLVPDHTQAWQYPVHAYIRASPQ